DQLSIVIEHLLEVRHEPNGVYRIAMKSAAELVIHPTFRHLAGSLLDHIKRSLIAGAIPVAKQEIERHRWWKLRTSAESAIRPVKRANEALIRGVEQVRRKCFG